VQFIGIVGTQNQHFYMVLMNGDGRLFYKAGRVFCYKFCVFVGVTVRYVAVGVESTIFLVNRDVKHILPARS